MEDFFVDPEVNLCEVYEDALEREHNAEFDTHKSIETAMLLDNMYDAAADDEPMALVEEEEEQPQPLPRTPDVSFFADTTVVCEEVIPKIIFIVPYRDREKHYNMFSTHMKSYLEKHYANEPRLSSRDEASRRSTAETQEDSGAGNCIDFILSEVETHAICKILYVHQTDARGFNRGAMKNIGFLVVKDMYPNDYMNITLVFNDIDTMPSRDVVLDYETTTGKIKHFYGFNYTLGGIVSVNAYDFEKLNGFPNFWAWGYEDNLFQMRAENANIVIDRSTFFKIQDPRIVHLCDTPIREINRTEFDRFLARTTEGISSLYNLTYKMHNDTGFVDVLSFESNAQEKVETRANYDLRNGPAPFKTATAQRRRPHMKMTF